MESNDNLDHKKSNGKFKSFIMDWILPIVIAMCLAFIINKLWFFFIKVPTGSMEPTIMPGDKILVTRVHNTKKLERGDVVVFESKELSEEYGKKTILVKRLIGLPGDSIVIEKDGSVYINDKLTEEPYVIHQMGIKKEFNVPEDKYFFLGDNRANSKDARYWENSYIDEKYIMGKARITFLPFNRFGKLK